MSDVSVMSERLGFLIELFAGEEGGNRLTLRQVRRINRGLFLFEFGELRQKHFHNR